MQEKKTQHSPSESCRDVAQTPLKKTTLNVNVYVKCERCNKKGQLYLLCDCFSPFTINNK